MKLMDVLNCMVFASALNISYTANSRHIANSHQHSILKTPLTTRMFIQSPCGEKAVYSIKPKFDKMMETDSKSWKLPM